MGMPRAFLPAAALTLAVAACNSVPPQGASSALPEPSAAPPAIASAPPAPAPRSAPRSTPVPSSAPAPASSGGVLITKNAQGEPMMTLDPADATCSSDADCGVTLTQCECDCGSAVNVARRKKYQEAFEPMCKNYSGRMCKMAPCSQTAICDEGVCRIKE